MACAILVSMNLISFFGFITLKILNLDYERYINMAMILITRSVFQTKEATMT